MTHDDAHLTTVLIYRCRGCGDVFPVHEDERPLCPSCAGDDVDLASEPLL